MHVLHEIHADEIAHFVGNVARASKGFEVEVHHVSQEFFNRLVIVESAMQMLFEHMVKRIFMESGQSRAPFSILFGITG